MLCHGCIGAVDNVRKRLVIYVQHISNAPLSNPSSARKVRLLTRYTQAHVSLSPCCDIRTSIDTTGTSPRQAFCVLLLKTYLMLTVSELLHMIQMPLLTCHCATQQFPLLIPLCSNFCSHNLARVDAQHCMNVSGTWTLAATTCLQSPTLRVSQAVPQKLCEHCGSGVVKTTYGGGTFKLLVAMKQFKQHTLLRCCWLLHATLILYLITSIASTGCPVVLGVQYGEYLPDHGHGTV